MATKVILPKLGQTMEEGEIVEWVKNEGDAVNRGDVLFTVESDKAVLEAESTAKGVLLKILVPKGVKVPVLTPVAIIGKPDEDITSLLQEAGVAPAAEAEPEEAPAPQAAAGEAPVVEEAAPSSPTGERVFASPRARMVARERGVDVSQVRGTGPGGRIVEKDVLTFAQAQPAATPLARRVAEELEIPLGQVMVESSRVRAADVRQAAVAPAALAAPGEMVPMAGVRAIIAQRMSASSQQTAAVTLYSVVDATELVALREELKGALAKELGFNVGFNDLLAAIVARCLAEFPYMNARLEEEGIRYVSEINVGMAVDTERGLIVPVLHNANQKGIKQLAIEFRELVARVREGKAGPDDLTGGTFTITNLGMYGVDGFSPIINLPECAILGVGRIRPEPAVVDGEIAIRQRMWLSLTFDHRLVDGAPAARFLQGITRYIEAPYLLLA